MQNTEHQSAFPNYVLGKHDQSINNHVHVIHQEESSLVAEDFRKDFQQTGQTTIYQGKSKTTYSTPAKCIKLTLTAHSSVSFSEKVSQQKDYFGFASDLLSSAYKFSRKSKPSQVLNIYLGSETSKGQQILNLVQTKNRSKQWANGRGDIEGVPEYFESIASNFAKNNDVKLTVIKGEELLKNGFRLMHAVGRSSIHPPTFINLSYNGNPDSNQWVAFVGKGVCFDSGGLDIKTAAGMLSMFLDKHGAVSVFSAFQSVVKEKLKINLTCSMGFVENFINQNSYRPSDIIKSRKGLTVQIGNTDAEGRLVLADCMNWTQQTYKCNTLIQLSTLTGAVIFALGHRFAGLFSNSKELTKRFIEAGQTVHEQSWELPVVDYHRQLIKPKSADLTNSSGKTQAGSSQAAAFLQNFVQKGVNWIHLDIAGVSMIGNQGNGFGSRVLLQFARNTSGI